ncbi:MAG: HEAT repeat domain-containing protein [Cyanobacteria bacterium P01_H01_bin.162]
MLESLAYLHYSCAYEQDDTPELNLEPVASGIGLSLAVLASFANLQSIQAIPALQQGDEGESVQDLNQRLQAAGCLPSRLARSPRYNEYTSAAVKSLQRQKGLEMADSFEGPVVGLVEAGENCNAAADAGALNPGDKSQDIAMLQQQLKNWGFPLAGQEHLAVTGDFQGDTQAALKEFEQFFGLEQDGILDVLDSKILWTDRNIELARLFDDLIHTDVNATARITTFLQSDSEVDRDLAAEALGKIGIPAVEIALPGLITLLDSDSKIDRKSAAEALGSMGSNAEAALPKLFTLLDSDDSNIRNAAAHAISSIGGTESVPNLISRLESPDVGIRSAAAISLREIGAEAKAAVPPLIEMLQSPNEEDRLYAAQALQTFDAEAEEAVPTLVTLLDSENPNVSGAAARAIGRIGGTKAVQDLITRLSSESEIVRIQAAEVLRDEDLIISRIRQVRAVLHSSIVARPRRRESAFAA